jgi:thiol:disulfide interchange protein DsbD
MRRLRIIGALFMLAVASATSHAQIESFGNGTPGPVKAKHLTVEFISSYDVSVPDEDQTVGLKFTMEPGWHIYWSNPGDAGEPPRIQWTLPAGITADPMQFPIPKKIPLGPLANYGYEGEVIFPIQLHFSHGVKAETLHANVDWLVCREVCIPGKAMLALHFPVAHNSTDEESLQNASTLPQPLPAAMHAEVSATKTEFLIAVHTGDLIDHAEFFPYDSDLITYAAPETVEPLPDGILIHVQKDPALTAGPSQLHGLIKLGDAQAYEFTAPVTLATNAPINTASHPAILIAIILAFLGGIILNLMPCVFPVLFLKALSLMKSAESESEDEMSRLRRHGVVYTLGVLVSFWAIVAVLLALRAGGSRLGWGFQLQSPQFVAVIVCLLFFMALSLAGQFDIGLTLTGTGDELTQKSGYAGSFFTGVLATLVATPCTGPLMGAATGFALSQTAGITLLVFTAMALGLASPYLALTLQPKWIRWLPKPGAWMEFVKHIVSVPMFLSVIWLIWVYGQLFTGTSAMDAVFKLLLALLLLAGAGWTLGRWPGHRRGAIIAALIVLLAVAVPLAPQKTDTSMQWEPYSPARLSELRVQGQPVFVDFTAAWCLSCQVNERVVLHSDAVQQELRAKHVALLHADWTKYDPQITAALGDLGRSGVPTYAVYPPGAGPVVLPEALTPGIVERALDALPDTAAH